MKSYYLSLENISFAERENLFHEIKSITGQEVKNLLLNYKFYLELYNTNGYYFLNVYTNLETIEKDSILLSKKEMLEIIADKAILGLLKD